MTQYSVHDAKTNLSKLIAAALDEVDVAIAHKDPFDRLLIAQAEELVLVSNESLFDSFAVQRLW